MNNPSRSIHTGLTGSVNLEILNSIIGQLSDGKWENSPGMRKYWEHANIVEVNNEVIINISDEYGSGYRGHDEFWVKNFFAGKIKNIVKDELDGSYSYASDDGWDRTNKRELSYLGGYKVKVTVADAYRAYDILKGRDARRLAKTAEGKAARLAAIEATDHEIASAEAALNALKAKRNSL